MKSSVLIISIIIFLSCGNSKTETVQENEETPDFLKGYKSTTLPLKMKGCSEDGLPLINSDSVNADMVNGTLPYCTFKTNGDYYAVIRLGLADCSLPSLITFDRKGRVIDQKELAIGYCGSGPGFRCEEFSIIAEDFSLYTSDTIAEMSIDSLGNEIEATVRKYIIYKKGKLLSSGKIELTDTIRQRLIK